MPDEHWTANLCTHAYMSVQIRPDGFLNEDDPRAWSGDWVSDDPIRATGKYCMFHWGGTLAVDPEDGGARPYTCAHTAGDAPQQYRGHLFIDPDTGGIKMLTATQNPRTFAARWTNPPGANEL